MNKTARVDGVIVYSDVFPTEQIEPTCCALARPTHFLNECELEACSIIRSVAEAFEAANGFKPSYVTLYNRVAIAWASDPHDSL